MLKLIRFKIALVLLTQAKKEMEKGTFKGLLKAARYFKWIRFVIPKTEKVKALIKKGDDSIKELGL